MLIFRYNTTIPISDMAALRREVDEIWNKLISGAEGGKYQQAIVSANGPSEGLIIKHSQGYNFVFEKENGNWRFHDFKSGESPKPTEQSVRGVMARFDTALDSKEMNAALLYLGDNWTQTLNFKGNNAAPSATSDRKQFAISTYQALTKAQSFKHTRKIDKVTVSTDGKSAQVESDENESLVLNGKMESMTEHTVDIMGVKSNSILLTNETSDVTVQ